MKTSVYIATSLDGFIARKDGALDWLPGSDGATESTGSDEDYGYKAFLDSIDVLVMGRHTFEMVRAFGQWPYGNKRVVVLSSTLTQIPQDVPKTVELQSGTVTDVYKKLEKSGAQHIYVDGGKTIQAFLDAGLLDDLIITTVPVIIGSGIPLFGPVTNDIKLNMIETRAFKNGFMQSHYKVLK